MEKRKRKGKAFIILFLIVLAILLLVFEFSKNTLWGWGLLLAAAVVFLILHQKVLKEKKGLIRFLSFAVFLALSFLIYRVSYPPYQRIPAVDVKDPVVTGVVTVSEGDLTGVFNEDQSVEVYAGIPEFRTLTDKVPGMALNDIHSLLYKVLNLPLLLFHIPVGILNVDLRSQIPGR